MFPGDNGVSIDLVSVTHTRFVDRVGDYRSVSIKTKAQGMTSISTIGQRLNQAIYFRNKSIYDNSDTYSYSDTAQDNLNIIPIIPDLTAIQMNSAVPGDYIELNPGEAITIPVQVKIKIKNSNLVTDISKKISFDVWDSPWQDPLTFTAEIVVPRKSSGITNVVDSMKNSGYVATLTKPEAISIKRTSRNSSILK